MDKELKIVFLSDTHGYTNEIDIPDGDVLIHGGDFMTCGYKEQEVMDFLKWFSGFPHEVKILVAGNHERFIENHRGIFLTYIKDLYPGITYLENEEVMIAGVKFYGTPNSKIFYNWAFNNTHEQLERIYANIPIDTHILISHAPAFGTLDRLENGDCVGERELRQRLFHLPILKYHLVGHIHSGAGKVEGFGRRFCTINGSIVDEEYQLTNKPWMINYKIDA